MPTRPAWRLPAPLLAAALSIAVAGCEPQVAEPPSSGDLPFDDLGTSEVEPPASGGETGSVTSGSTGETAHDTREEPPERTADPTSGEETAAQWAPAPCEAPAQVAEDPVWLTDSIFVPEEPNGYSLTHLLDLAVEPGGERVYAAAVGGLHVFDVSDDGLELVAIANPPGRLHRVEAMGDHLVACTERDHGTFIFDASDVANIVPRGAIKGSDHGDVSYADQRLYLIRPSGSLEVYDWKGFGSPQLLAVLDGFGTPWDIVVQGDLAFVSDAALGVVVVDVALPTEPQILATTPEVMGARELVLRDDLLFVAAGASGVFIMDASDPLELQVISQMETGGSAESVATAGDWLWAATQQGVVVADVSDPSDPILQASQHTPEWAMHVEVVPDFDVAGAAVWVADWSFMERYEMDPGAAAPVLEVSPPALYLGEQAGPVTLTVSNRGPASLNFAGLGGGHPALSLEESAQIIEPGETVLIDGTWGGATLAPGAGAVVCLMSDDPDAPVLDVPLLAAGADADSGIGTEAPDFVLPDEDGEFYQLSDYLGQPVLLTLFASW